jgi:hypothetical protein
MRNISHANIFSSYSLSYLAKKLQQAKCGIASCPKAEQRSGWLQTGRAALCTSEKNEKKENRLDVLEEMHS